MNIRSRLRHTLTLTTVLAAAALAVAVFGIAGPQGYPGLQGPPAARYMIHVQWNGTVISEAGGAIGVTHDPFPMSTYTLSFPGNISQYYPFANPQGGAGDFIVMAGISGINLTVRTYDFDGFPGDHSFYLALVCG